MTDPPAADETSLVARSRAGDREAFEELARRTARLVFARIYLETGDPHRAEDLVQETYLSAWRSIRQVEGANGFRPWLMSIAHTTVVDSVRRESRKKRKGGLRASDEALQDVPDRTPQPPDAAAKSDERRRVLSVLRSLPQEYREPLMLRYLMGADYETIGRQLAISNGSLRGLLSRGLAMLRKELKEDVR